MTPPITEIEAADPFSKGIIGHCFANSVPSPLRLIPSIFFEVTFASAHLVLLLGGVHNDV